MIPPSFGFRVRDYGRLLAAGAITTGQLLLKVGKIALGIIVMWMIVFYGMVAFPFKIFKKS